MIELEKADTGFGYMIQAYKMGGPYMNVISLFGLVALLIVLFKIYEIVVKKSFSLRYLDLVKMSATVALAVGILAQILGIVMALEAIRVAADVSPQIIMAGAIVSFYAPVWGFFVFIFGMMLFYILKEIIENRTKRTN